MCLGRFTQGSPESVRGNRWAELHNPVGIGRSKAEGGAQTGGERGIGNGKGVTALAKQCPPSQARYSARSGPERLVGRFSVGWHPRLFIFGPVGPPG
jgi:hypothetical protein